jgi:hypothetical protein
VDGAPGIAVHSKTDKTMSLYALEKSSGNCRAQLVSSMPALAVACVQATRKNLLDLLILRKDGTLLLEDGSNTQLQCQLSDHDLTTTVRLSTAVTRLSSHKRERDISVRQESRSVTRHVRISGFRDAVDHQVTILLSAGAQVRVNLNFAIRSKLIQRCFDVLQKVLETEPFFAMRKSFLAFNFGEKPVRSEWDAFIACITPDAVQHQVLFGLHLVYEESKLNVLCRKQSKKLAELLVSMAGLLGLNAFLSHYENDHPDILQQKQFDGNTVNLHAPLDFLRSWQQGIAWSELASVHFPVLPESRTQQCLDLLFDSTKRDASEVYEDISRHLPEPYRRQCKPKDSHLLFAIDKRVPPHNIGKSSSSASMSLNK